MKTILSSKLCLNLHKWLTITFSLSSKKLRHVQPNMVLFQMDLAEFEFKVEPLFLQIILLFKQLNHMTSVQTSMKI